MIKKLIHKTHLKSHCLIIFMLCIVLLTPILVSSFEFDNVQNIKESKGLAGYNDIEIKNLYGYGNILWSGTLNSNTDKCSDNCESTQTITLHKDGVLIDEIIFKTLQDDGTWVEQSIRSYQVYANEKIYELGTELDKGIYEVRLKGSKKSSRTVDWIYKTQGETLDSWATWFGAFPDGAIAYYPLDELTGSANDSVAGLFNLTEIVQVAQGVNGKIGTAYYFNDDSSCINDSTPDLLENGTISFWINYNKTSDGHIVNKDNNDPRARAFELHYGNHQSDGFRIRLAYDNDAGQQQRLDTDVLSVGTWFNIVFTWNLTTTELYLDSVSMGKNVSNGVEGFKNMTKWNIGSEDGCTVTGTNGTIDEFGVWNRSLTADEVSAIYNDGDGLPFGFVGSTITLNAPVDGFNSTTSLIDFNCSATVTQGALLTNISLYHNGTGTFEINQTNSTVAVTSNTTIFSSPFIDGQSALWTCEACDSDGDCALAQTNRTVHKPFVVFNNQSFNAVTYETAQETFSINATGGTSANFIYDGTSFIATQSGDIWTRTINIDTITNLENKTFFWSFNSGIANSSRTNQSVFHTNFSHCGFEGGTVPFINFTFFNETINQEATNATISSTFVYWLGTGTINKTETFSNSTENPVYSFCSTPPDRTLNINYLVDYNNARSQQRSFTEARTITNTTLVKSLYLLPSGLGIFTTFKTQDTLTNVISLVTGTITRVLGGSTITVASGLTDSSGIVVFFLNPDATYAGSFSKAGFVTNDFAFVPITDIRTVIMGTSGAPSVNGTQISLTTQYQTFPINSSLQNNTNFLFGLNVTSDQTITLISMNITSPNGTQLGFQSNAGVGFISETINTKNLTRINGAFLIQTSNETIEFGRVWFVGNEFIGDYSIFKQLTLFLDYEFKDFTRLLIVIAVIFGLMIFLTAGQITDTSESQIGVLIILVWIFSAVGWLQNPVVVATTGLAQFSGQYGIAILVTAGGLFFILRRLLIRRI